MANIRDVAKKAGVGVGTVSRTLSNKGYVAKETRNKILEAADEVGYRYDIPGQPSLKDVGGIVGVIVPIMEHPFFSKMMAAIEFELSTRGYKCLVCNTLNITNRMEDFVSLLDARYLDGVIALADPPPDFQGRKKRAIVSMDRQWGDDVPMIRADHEQGGRLAAQVFLEDGCRNIVQFCNGEYRKSANIRHDIMEEELRKKGCNVTTIRMAWNNFSYYYNKNIIQSYWNVVRESDGCMTNDIGALSCLAFVQEMGMKVPEDFKVIGYDGTEITNLSYPELTVIEQDCTSLAKACVHTLIQMIEGRDPEQMLVKIPVNLRRRGTA